MQPKLTIGKKSIDEVSEDEEIAAYIDNTVASPAAADALVALLPEQASIYNGHNANSVIHLRGYLLASFAECGLPVAALPFVLQELESGHRAYIIAGAAKALRSAPAPSEAYLPYLLQAMERMRFTDDAITFATFNPHWPVEEYTTALAEIFQSIEWLGAHATSALPALEAFSRKSEGFPPPTLHALASALATLRSHIGQRDSQGPSIPKTSYPITLQESFHPPAPTPEQILAIPLEDQDGKRFKYGDFFTSLPAVVVFFYTRCDNPNKCTLTITKLARLQGLIDQGYHNQIKTAAITYDPAFDTPARLHKYGTLRGIRFDENNRILRTLGNFDILQTHLNLGVNYSASIVNHHRIELFILNAEGQVVESVTHLQWEAEEILLLAQNQIST